LHTGQAYQQIKPGNRWVHTAYENYVSDNWNKGYKYNNSVRSTTSYYKITGSSKSAVAWQLILINIRSIYFINIL